MDREGVSIMTLILFNAYIYRFALLNRCVLIVEVIAVCQEVASIGGIVRLSVLDKHKGNGPRLTSWISYCVHAK